MGVVFFPTSLQKKTTIHVGKYANLMDPVGYGRLSNVLKKLRFLHL